MEAYSDFASVYDIFMEETPYGEWAEFLALLIQEYGISEPYNSQAKEAGGLSPEEEALNSEKNLVVDLGCGTGTLTELLYAKGYDIIGIDNSQEMLNIALNKKEKTGSNILYLWQDMRTVDLYSTTGTIISVCDSINYLLDGLDVESTFKGVNNYLYPGGIFIFDFNTVYKYETVIGDATIAENREDCSFIWENYYDTDTGINEYDLTIFVRDKDKRELFRKFEETHFQRGYTLEEMKCFAEAAGMEWITALDAQTHGEPSETSERIYAVTRKVR